MGLIRKQLLHSNFTLSPYRKSGEELVKFMGRILLVEDEEPIAAVLQRGLKGAGHEVSVSHDGDEGERLARDGTFDLILLDLMLPGQDGISICRHLREAGDETPILMLTARDSVRDRLEGFKTGADDYLGKPFSFAELLARVESLLRRRGSRTEPCASSKGDSSTGG